MQVFKLFFKIIRDNKASIIVSFIVTLVITTLFINGGGTANANNTEAKPLIYITSQSDSLYAQGLEDYLGNKCKIVEIDNDKIEDALFYEQVYYALTIPGDFETKLKDGETIDFSKRVIKESAASYLVDQYINSYMSSLQSNVMYNSSLSEKQILTLVNEDLTSEVEEKSYGRESNASITLYFNFLAYALCASIISGVGFVLLKMNSKVIKRRNAASPISNTSVNFQLILASIIFVLSIGGLGVIMAYMNNFAGMQEVSAKFMVLNMFVNLIPGLGLAYLIGMCVKSLEVQSGLGNVISLGFAFLGGSFVPQALLSADLLKVSTFVPTYWYVRANEELSTLNSFDWNSLQPIFGYMIIQILFGIAFFSIAIIFMKHSQKNIT